MDIVEKFSTYIKKNYYYVAENEKNISLIETKGSPYQIDLKIDREVSKFLVIHNLEELKKEDAGYLLQHPQDCDYVILDLLNNVVYLMELKDTDISTTEFMKQLRAGESWLSHLLFCCKCEVTIDEWEIKRVGMKYQKGRPSSKLRRPRKAEFGDNLVSPLKYIKDVTGFDIYLFQGSVLRIDAIQKV